MITCYIIDDDIHSIEAITKNIVKTPNVTLLGSNTNPLVALEEIRNRKTPDIVFLDVEMPELSGIEVADLLDPSIAVVFTTSHSKYAFQAFQKDAVDFLLKPFSFEMFLKCINKIKNKISSSPNHTQEADKTSIFVNAGIKGKIIQIEFAEVTHIEAIEHSVYFNLPTEKIATNISIKKIQDKLPTKTFIRIHRTYIVNISFIKVVEANQITLKNGVQIPLGDVYRNNLMSKIKE